jgi:hypothetical protein
VSGRGERIGCGCVLIAVGIPVAFVGYLYVGLADTYGTDYWWQKLILWAVLLASVAAVVWGAILIFGNPPRK